MSSLLDTSDCSLVDIKGDWLQNCNRYHFCLDLVLLQSDEESTKLPVVLLEGTAVVPRVSSIDAVGSKIMLEPKVTI